MRTALLIGVVTAGLLVGGVAVAASQHATELVVTPVAAMTEPEVSPVPDEVAFGDRLERRLERRSERRTDRRERLEDFRRDVAAELGLVPDEIIAAVVKVASERVDAALEAGLIEEATATELRDALDRGDPDEVREVIRELLRAASGSEQA